MKLWIASGLQNSERKIRQHGRKKFAGVLEKGVQVPETSLSVEERSRGWKREVTSTMMKTLSTGWT